jgi:transposase, IS30 family
MSYRQLNVEERTLIARFLSQGCTCREISRHLGRSHSTIIREIKRNALSEEVYLNTEAHARALRRRRQPRHWQRMNHRPLVRYVFKRLAQRFSPEIIAGRIKRDYPQQALMRVCPETIYRWIYRDGRQGGGLWQYLTTQRRARRRQTRYASGRRHHIPGRVGIEMRSPLVARRARFGDWEGDSIVGRGGRSAIASQIERKSRLLEARALKDRSARSWSQQAVSALKRLPEKLRRTLTVDNGSEFSTFSQIEKALGLRVFFADAYAAWQRGSIENANGLLRRYFPRGTDFTQITHQKLATVVRMINHRPRKCLNYQTPHEVSQRALRGAL